jgi:hypothetical protein
VKRSSTVPGVPTDTPQRSVLLIGASQRVLDHSVAALRDPGYVAKGTNDFFSLDDRLPACHHTISVPDHVFLPARRSPNSP